MLQVYIKIYTILVLPQMSHLSLVIFQAGK